jgi:CO/xanthine dehydrogenase FAD-binding subunit
MKTVDSLSSALKILNDEPQKWRPLAGGTDLMVLYEAGKLPEAHYLNIWNLEELKGIEVDADHITLGALTTFSELQENETIQQDFPMLVEAAKLTGAIAIQNRGTLGGNIVNASPAADSPPALLCYDAEIELVSSAGSRWIKYQDFHTGYKQMMIKPDEILSKIKLPRKTAGTKQFYRKVGTRKAQAISKICISALAKWEHDPARNAKKIIDIRLAFASVAAIPFRALQTEEFLRGKSISAELIKQAVEKLGEEINPIDDIRSTHAYRLLVSQNLLKSYLESL